VTLFLVGAPLIALLFGDDRIRLGAQLLGANVVILIVGYAVTAYGLVPMLGWGVREVGVQLRGLVVLLARSLPLLLLFATFLFLNAEMWQVAHDLTPALFVVVIVMVLVPAFAFLALRSPDEIANMHAFESWTEIDAICAGTDAPMPVRTEADPTRPDLVPLDEGERRNLALLMIIAQVVQIVLVSLVIGAFFVVFGLVTVREATIEQWTEIEPGTFDPLTRFSLFGTDVVVTWELFAVSGFIASISALQFAVSVVSDELYRRQFFVSLEREIKEVLAVRARYLEPMVAEAFGRQAH
jgi:Ca2+/Na+ antiporter